MPRHLNKQRILTDLLLISIIVILFVVVIGLVQRECLNIRAPKKLELKDYRFSGSKMRSCAISVIGYRLETEFMDPKNVKLEYPGMLDTSTVVYDISLLKDHVIWRLSTCDKSDFNVIYWYKVQLMQKDGYLNVIRKWNKGKQKFNKSGFEDAMNLIGKGTIEFIDKQNDKKLSRAEDTDMIKFLGWPS